MLKTFGTALLLTCGLAITTSPALALQVVVTGMDKNGDGSTTYHYAVKTDPGETLSPGSDFVTVYNFSMVDGSAKTPAGWAFTSPEFGKTPTWNGYPVVLPVDIPALNNLTWTATKTIPGGSQIDGFSATTHASASTDGEYTAQVTRSAGGKSSKQAIIGHIPTPAYTQ
jgi:hypothetical protein